jgi:HlyD family secretion protein
LEIKNHITEVVPDNPESSVVQEIISSRPEKWVRWGSLFFLFLLVITGIIAYFISYPDIVTINGRLVSLNAPKEVRVKKSGKLIKLFKKEGEQAQKNELIGFIESTASHTEVLELSHLIDTLDTLMLSGNGYRIPSLALPGFQSLGELQPHFQVFVMDLAEFSDYTGDGFFIRKRKMLQQDIVYLQQLNTELKIQKGYMLKDIELTDSTFEAQAILKSQNVISGLDYRQEKSKLLNKKISLPQINASIITNEAQQHEKRKEIAELENRIKEQAEIFHQALYTLKSRISEWKEKYFLIAQENGIISFTIFWQENQQLSEGQSFCYVIPANTGIYAEAIIPQYNFGKVKTGQEVKLALSAYPESEFGKINGRLAFIATIPSDSGYMARISLPQNLLTTTQKLVSYRPGLTFTARIITEKKNLLQRLFDNLRRSRR